MIGKNLPQLFAYLVDANLLKIAEPGSISQQGLTIGRQSRPHSFEEGMKLRFSSPYHGTCLLAKVACSVGLGFETEAEQQQRQAEKAKQAMEQAMAGKPAPKPGASGGGSGGGSSGGSGDSVAKIMADVAKAMAGTTINQESKIYQLCNPLTERGLQPIVRQMAEDLWENGNGYWEVRRNQQGNIIGLHYLPATSVHVYLEDSDYNYHYEINARDDGDGRTRRFAKFGDQQGLFERMTQTGSGYFGGVEVTNAFELSEVIHFKLPTNGSRWYGRPDWLSAVPSIQLMGCLGQHLFDFFNNRGVPEFILAITGGALDDNTKREINEKLKATIGQGQQFKSMFLNFPNPNIKAEILKLASDGKVDGLFGELSDTLALHTVSAHRTPPLLAGIQMPGKLGANNELPNALLAFQTLTIEPEQVEIVHQICNTLANPETNGGFGLQPSDVRLRQILDRFDIGQMSTMSAMRTPVVQAQAEGRKLADGLKKADLRDPAFVGSLLAAAIQQLAEQAGD